MKVFKNEDLLLTEKKIQLEIREIGHAFLDQHWNYQNVCYSFSQLYIPIQGEAQLLFPQQTVILKPGNLYILPAGLRYCCRCTGELEKYLMDFSVSQADGMDLLTGLDHCICLPDETHIRNQISDIYARSDLHCAIQVKLLLLQVLDQLLSTENIHVTLSNYSGCTKDALRYINQHLSAQLTIGQIAEALFVSRLALQKHFRTNVGRPIGKYIDERIMAIAERYLLEETRSIKEISDILGFCDQFYFSRKFRQYHGFSPMQFRRIHRFTSSQV